MSCYSAVIHQVSCRAEKSSCHVGNFAEGQVDKEGTDKKKMEIKGQTYSGGNHRMETHQPHTHFFYFEEVYLKKIPHEDTRYYNTCNEKDGKVVRGKGDIPCLRIDYPSQEKVCEGNQYQCVGY